MLLCFRIDATLGLLLILLYDLHFTENRLTEIATSIFSKVKRSKRNSKVMLATYHAGLRHVYGVAKT